MRSGARCGVGFPPPDRIENRVTGIFFGPHDRQAPRVGSEVILHVAIFRVTTAEVSGIARLHGGAGCRAVGVSAANESEPERVHADRFFDSQPVFQHVAQQVAGRELLDGDRQAAF